MRVLKFGGKSLNSKDKFIAICKYIKQSYKKDKHLIIVVSAIGNTTDKLIEIANDYGYNQKADVELAKLLSTGEIQSASLLAIMLISMGVPAKSLSAKDISISTFGDYLNSKISYINKSKLNDILESETIAIVAGFQGINDNDEITTLGRGGSDTTAVAIASIFNVSAEIYSDYNGVFLGDPKYNKFKKIKQTNYNNVINMAESGAKVLDKRAIEIAKKSNIKIISKSSSNPNLKGTIISNIESNIISICEISNLCKITINISNNLQIKKIINIVFNILNNYKFYNFTYLDNKISFFVEEKNKIIIYNDISKKLKLLSIKKY